MCKLSLNPIKLTMNDHLFEIDVSRQIWESRYRYLRDGFPVDKSVQASWRRVACALAAVEDRNESDWSERFLSILNDFRFLPGGRILAGAGTDFDVTLFNCFVMGRIEDSMEGIFNGLKQGAITMQQGGGVGYDFSTLRPAGTVARRVGSMASGPVSFMRIWDSMCATLVSSAFRRGAMMATLRCDHPDIETFIDAKRDPRELRNFNLSILVSDAFMQALADDAPWPLVFPLDTGGEQPIKNDGEIVHRRWSGAIEEVPCRVVKEVSARALWERIMQANYDMAEPGVLFIDRINRLNNLSYREDISATNPCGEIPLPAYGACNLGSLNLTRFVEQPFSAQARLDISALEATVAVAVRMLDNVIELSRFPLDAQAEQARGSRRIGLGITGLADMLMMLGLHYADEAARKLAAQVMQQICVNAYRESVALAQEKGAFPFFERDSYIDSPFIQNLPEAIRQGIFNDGIRNSHLIAIAPAGTISLFANNVSSGIEPVFSYQYQRRIRGADGEYGEHTISDYAWRLWQKQVGKGKLPGYFVSAFSLEPQDHLAMQAALQSHVDSAVSKTINVPSDYEFAAFKNLYLEAYRLGLKGCTTFRPNEVTGSVMSSQEGELALAPETGCCSLDRESG